MKNSLMALVLLLCLAAIQGQGKVCIDAGHGGSDPGAVGWGLQEKSINLDAAQRLAGLLRNAGWTVYLTRNGDETVSLSSRTSYANSVGAQRFISIHCNACNQSAHGTETFCYTSGSSTSFTMRNKVHPEVVKAMGTYDRGCKTATFYVLKYTNMPAILCELAFIDHQGDAAKLGDSGYRQRAAEAIKRGLQSSMAREAGDSETSEGYIAPRWSPDASRLLVTTPGCRGLYLVELGRGGKTVLSEGDGVGYRADWLDNGSVRVETPEESFVVDVRGNRLPAADNREYLSVVARDGVVRVESPARSYPLSRGKDVFFNPRLSPDNSMVAYQGLASGLHICRVTGEGHISLGQGSNPSWSADSRKLFFDRTTDDGNELTSGDIWVVEIARPHLQVNITRGGGKIAQRPCVSPDGRRLAFDCEGKIYLAELDGERIGALEVVPID